MAVCAGVLTVSAAPATGGMRPSAIGAVFTGVIWAEAAAGMKQANAGTNIMSRQNLVIMFLMPVITSVPDVLNTVAYQLVGNGLCFFGIHLRYDGRGDGRFHLF